MNEKTKMFGLKRFELSLWILSLTVMAACFVMFLVNDMYGYFNWRRMKRRQNRGE